MNFPACWCGNTRLIDFAPFYRRCPACETLVALPQADPAVRYRRDYWFDHQTSELGLPDIEQRARLDLPERCAHWLNTLLDYRLPPASCLEIGCAHGAFVSLLRRAGFDAIGLELDPEIAALAQHFFDVPVLCGPIEQQTLEPSSLDIIVLMDVLEHLPDPSATIRHCLHLLKPGGLLLVQTPCFPEGTLLAADSPFRRMLLPDEHLYLFSRKSMVELFSRAGAEHVAFEPALFLQHDMFAAVSRFPMVRTDPHERDRCLTATPDGRFALALIDARRQLAASEKDRAARLDIIHRQQRDIQRLDRPLWQRLFKGIV